MNKMIYIVEEWATVTHWNGTGATHDACKASYCFTDRPAAELFKELMEGLYGDKSSQWYIEDTSVFGHINEAIALVHPEWEARRDAR
jgi:hypothetical protein